MLQSRGGRGGRNRGRGDYKNNGNRPASSNGTPNQQNIRGPRPSPPVQTCRGGFQGFTSPYNNQNSQEFFTQNQNLHPFFYSSESTVEQSWYTDSGATNHITLVPSQLSNCSQYSGKNFLLVGNGHALPILYVGNDKVPSTSSSLTFSNSMCVPHITKNLLSISQLARENNAVIEFDSEKCFVKDS
ncbi:hypothetical protein Scep_009912 [Stephania cephalantha]|uniref:Retrovirus-related Pol polyprotein from transposon TNT 1-94-like beta-barrel domain-containing protein n=1 Tax=Stephania cephalantha TaxID=152367 RepID=A0AAP0PGQ4_9MAGN